MLTFCWHTFCRICAKQLYLLLKIWALIKKSMHSLSLVLKCLMYHLTEKPVDMQEHSLHIIVDKSGARQLQSVICYVMFWGHLAYRKIK